MSPVPHDHTPSLRRLHGLVWFARVFRPMIDWAAIRRPFRRLVTANGIELAVSALDFSVSRTLLRDGSWEPITSDLMRTRLSEGDTAVDIGAHLGYHTLLMSRAVGPTGRVVAFEPDRRLASLLTHNVARNGAHNVEVVEAAATDRNGVAFMRTNIALPQTSTPTVRIDDVLGAGATVDLVKIDIDGGEAEALKGMSRTLRASPHPSLIAEYDPWQHEVRSEEATTFRSLLRDMGFRPKSVIDEANGTVIDAAEATDPLPNHGAINLWYERD